MKLRMEPKAKSSAVKIGAFRIFGDDKNDLRTEEELVRRFDEAWNKGLGQAIERAIKDDKKIQPNIIEEMLQKQFWKAGSRASAWLNVNKLHFQFTYQVLYVVQVEYKENTDEYLIDQLWSFTFPDAIHERFCLQFDGPEDKERFENFARSLGQEPKEFAKRAIMGRIEDIEQQQKLLEAHRNTLAHCVLQKAQLGIYTPPYVLNQMQQSRKDIQRAKQILRNWHVSVKDLPDDTE